jgi:hypothetical protein
MNSCMVFLAGPNKARYRSHNHCKAGHSNTRCLSSSRVCALQLEGGLWPSQCWLLWRCHAFTREIGNFVARPATSLLEHLNDTLLYGSLIGCQGCPSVPINTASPRHLQAADWRNGVGKALLLGASTSWQIPVHARSLRLAVVDKDLALH